MKSVIAALAVAGGSVAIAAFAWGAAGRTVSAVAPQDQIYVSGISLVSGTIQVAVSTGGSSQGPYSGDNVTLTYDTSKLTFSNFDTTGSVLGAGQICLPGAYAPQPGVSVVSCGATSTSSSAAGLLNTIKLTPNGTGCVAIHIRTEQEAIAADGSDTFGTATLDASSGAAQNNTYGPDVLVDLGTGGTCAPSTSTSTATFTATQTPTPSSTATSTSTPTQTPTAIAGYPDLTVGLFPSPTNADSGGTASFTAYIQNQGNVASDPGTLRVTPPPGMILTSPLQCPVYAGGNFYCPIPALQANNGLPGGPDETSISLPVRLPYSTSKVSPPMTVLVSSPNEPVGNQGNNSASAAVSIAGCPDFNGDNSVNASDLVIFTQAWATHTGDANYNALVDLNGDGFINASDLVLFANKFSTNCVGLDSDHDGISNYDEINVTHTCPSLAPQFNSLAQCHVGASGVNPLIPDPADTDADGLPDGLEVFGYHSNPLLVSTAGDFYSDGAHVSFGKNPLLYCNIMAADMNMDTNVNASDLVLFASSFARMLGDPAFNPRADFNHDAHVNASDLTILAGAFNKNVRQCP